MKILDRLWAASTSAKIAIGLVVLGTFIGVLTLTLMAEYPDDQNDLTRGDLWVGTLFFYVVAAIVWGYELWQRKLRRKRREGGEVP
jgi:hypothetical protein